MDNRGFTLIELVVVLFIIGIASALVGVVLYRGMDETRLKTTAKEVSASLRYARAQAVAEKKVYVFVMDKSGYWLYAEMAGNGSETGGEREKPVFYKPLSNSIIVEYEGEDRVRIDFFPMGDSTGGEIRLKTREGSMLIVTVERITGRVRIERQGVYSP